MRLEKLLLRYFMKGHFHCSIDNTFFNCDGLNRVSPSVPKVTDYEIYILRYTNKTPGRAVVSFVQLDDEVFLMYDVLNYKLTLINKKEMHVSDGVNDFAITRIRN